MLNSVASKIIYLVVKVFKLAMHFTCSLKSKVILKRCRMRILTGGKSDQGN